ncbi:MAG: regulatory protein RecX [Bacteroidota bacterium]
MVSKQNLTPQQAFQKIKQYCAYQERCHSEVKEKLYGYGLSKNDTEDIVSKLISENYLNEERFASLFAGGKFRTKGWGKTKIRFELKKKQISDYCIKKALGQIDYDDYLKTLENLFEKKLATLKSEKKIYIKKRKLQDYMLQKGFESDLIRDHLKTI